MSTKVTIVTPPPAPTPPSKVVIELSMDDAKKLKALINLVFGEDLDGLWHGFCQEGVEAFPYYIESSDGGDQSTVVIKKH